MTRSEIKFAAEYCQRLQLFLLNGVLEYYDETGLHVCLLPIEHKRALQFELVKTLEKYSKYFGISGNRKFITYYSRKSAKSSKRLATRKWSRAIKVER